jgi:hypothetical protein
VAVKKRSLADGYQNFGRLYYFSLHFYHEERSRNFFRNDGMHLLDNTCNNPENYNLSNLCREIIVDKKEQKTFPYGIFCLILKYFLWQQICYLNFII